MLVVLVEVVEDVVVVDGCGFGLVVVDVVLVGVVVAVVEVDDVDEVVVVVVEDVVGTGWASAGTATTSAAVTARSAPARAREGWDKVEPFRREVSDGDHRNGIAM